MNNAYFYIPQKRIKKYVHGSIIEIIDRAKDPWLFDEYVQRV